MIKPNPKNGIGSKLEPVLRIRYSEMAIPTLITVRKQSFPTVFELQLHSKLMKYLRRKGQRNRLKVIAAQALSQVK